MPSGFDKYLCYFKLDLWNPFVFVEAVKSVWYLPYHHRNLSMMAHAYKSAASVSIQNSRLSTLTLLPRGKQTGYNSNVNDAVPQLSCTGAVSSWVFCTVADGWFQESWTTCQLKLWLSSYPEPPPPPPQSLLMFISWLTFNTHNQKILTCYLQVQLSFLPKSVYKNRIFNSILNHGPKTLWQGTHIGIWKKKQASIFYFN